MNYQSSNIAWTILYWLDTISGFYILKQSPLTRKNSIHRISLCILFFISFVLLTSTLFISYNNLLICIITLCTLIILVAIGCTMYKYITCSNELKIVFEWLQNVENLHRIEFAKAKENCNLWIKYLTIVIFVFGSVSVFVTFLIGCIFPGLLFPKFKPPLPFYLPVENHDTWFIYFVTSFLQISAYVQGNYTAVFGCGLIIKLFFNISTYHDIILMEIKNLKVSIDIKNQSKPRGHRRKSQKSKFNKQLGKIVNMITESYG